MILRSAISILFFVFLPTMGATSKTVEDGETGYETGKQSDRGFAAKKIRRSRHRRDTSHVQVSSTCNAVLAVPLSYPSGPFPPSAAAVSRAASASIQPPDCSIADFFGGAAVLLESPTEQSVTLDRLHYLRSVTLDRHTIQFRKSLELCFYF